MKPTRGGATIAFSVRNVGHSGGVAVPQLYLGIPAAPGAPQPPAQLKGFERIQLAPGHSARVRLRVDSRALSYWVSGTGIDGAWRVAPGCYQVMVGGSSRDLPLRAVLSEGGAKCVRPGARGRRHGSRLGG